MALLRPKQERRCTHLPAYTTICCPYNGHQVSWCRGLCEPIDDRGICGRIAPHKLIGRTQAAIAKFQERNVKAALER